MVSKADPSVIVPGVTEIPPAISSHCPDAAMLGVIAKVGHLRYTSAGIVVANSDSDPYATIVHPTQTSVVLLQPSADSFASWDDEAKECINICDALRQLQWQGLLTRVQRRRSYRKGNFALGKARPAQPLLACASHQRQRSHSRSIRPRRGVFSRASHRARVQQHGLRI